MPCLFTCLRQTLVTHFPEPATCTTRGLFMRARDVILVPIAFHFSQQIEQGLLQFLGVIHCKITSLVMDDSIRRAFAIRFFDKQTIGCQLINVRSYALSARLIPPRRGDRPFCWKRYSGCLSLASGIKKWLLQIAPAARIG